MTDRSVAVRLRMVVTDYISGAAQAAKATRGIIQEVDDLGRKSPQRINDIALAAGGLGTALLGIAGYAVTAAAAFDKQMSEVSAVSNATGKNLDDLRNLALQAGKDTQFSATEAAKAEAELSKAGVSTADIMGGALAGSLSLAAAGQMDLADAATIAAQTMNIFELKGRDVSHIADVLASAANVSAADMHGLGQGLQQVGLVAHQAGFSLEETVGVLAAFADRGLQGSDGATSLKTAIQRLTAPTQESAAAMRQLGLQVYDSNGHVKSAADLAGALQKALGGLSEADRNAALNTIFGSDAIRAANVLYKLGEDGVNKYTKAVDQNGAAADVAAKKTDNLAGDLERLKGSVETLAIQAGSGANGGLRMLVQGADAAVGAFSALPAPLQSTVTMVAGIGGAGLLATAGLLKIRQTALDAKDALLAMGTMGETVAAGIGKIGKLAGPIGLAIGAVVLLNSVIDSMRVKWKPVEADLGKLSDSLKVFNESGRMAGEVLRITGGNWATFAQRVSGSVVELRHMQDVQKGVAKADWDSPAEGALRYQHALHGLGQSTRDLNDLGKSLVDMFKAGDVAGAAAQYDQLTTALREAGVPAEMINRAFKDYLDLSGGLSASQYAAATSTQAATLAMQLQNSTLEDAINKTGSLKQALDTLNGVQINLTQAQINAEAAVDSFAEALENSGGSLDLNSEKGRAAMQSGLDLARSASEVAQRVYDQTGSLEQASGAFNGYRDRLIQTMIQSGMTRQAAENLASQIMQIPDFKKIDIQVPGIDAATEKVIGLRTAISGLENRTVTITTIQNTQTGQTYEKRSYSRAFERWGGITEHAQTGLLRDADLFTAVSSGARYGFAEPATGGEAFIPKNGDLARSRGIWSYVGVNWLGMNPAGGGGQGTLAPSRGDVHVHVYPPAGASTGEIVAQVKRELAWELG